MTATAPSRYFTRRSGTMLRNEIEQMINRTCSNLPDD